MTGCLVKFFYRSFLGWEGHQNLNTEREDAGNLSLFCKAPRDVAKDDSRLSGGSSSLK